MERRKFVIGLGALASGTAAAVGTGAFSSVTANRDVEVAVADDANAYLRLEGTGGSNSDYVVEDGNGGTLAIDLSDSNDDVEGGGQGVNPDAVTQIDDLFVVENQGTQDVEITLTKDGGEPGTVDFYPGEYEDAIEADDGITLGAGNSETISIEVDTQGIDADTELLDSVTINADAA